MKIVLQKVRFAQVTVEGKVVAKIAKGALLFVGFAQKDQEGVLQVAAKKVLELRYFEDEEGKMNLSLEQVQGQLLVVSQFTLLADCKKGRRPDFFDALEPKTARHFFDRFVSLLRTKAPVETGNFGAEMHVELINEGPVTLLLEF